MKMYSFLLFFICLNVAAFIINEAMIIEASQEFVATPEDVSDVFSLGFVSTDPLELLIDIGLGAGFAGLIAFLTKNPLAAIAALVIWVVGNMLPIIDWFFDGLPMLLSAILPSELSYVGEIFHAFYMIVFFMFIIELVGQRSIT